MIHVQTLQKNVPKKEPQNIQVFQHTCKCTYTFTPPWMLHKTKATGSLLIYLLLWCQQLLETLVHIYCLATVLFATILLTKFESDALRPPFNVLGFVRFFLLLFFFWGGELFTHHFPFVCFHGENICLNNKLPNSSRFLLFDSICV